MSFLHSDIRGGTFMALTECEVLCLYEISFNADSCLVGLFKKIALTLFVYPECRDFFLL